MGTVISFEERGIATLRARCAAAEEANQDLIAFARGHSGAVASIHEAVLAAVEAEGFDHLIHVVTQDWPQILGLDAVAVALYVGDRGMRADASGLQFVDPRVIQRSHQLPPRTVYDWRHYLAVLQRKPGALRNGAPFTELPSAFRQLQDLMLRRPGGDREMVDILALVLHHDEQAVLVAVELALADNVPTKTHVLNLLHRLVDGKTTGGPPIDTPQALALRREPRADVERYDGLRVRIAGGRHAS